jgi:hypothetical protein
MLDSPEAFAQVRQGSNIQLLPYPLVTQYPRTTYVSGIPRP